MPPVLFAFLVIFGIGAWIFALGQNRLRYSYLGFPCSWDNWQISWPQPAYLLRWGLTDFLPVLALYCHSPDLSLASSLGFQA
jgi:hypothetical protein